MNVKAMEEIGKQCKTPAFVFDLDKLQEHLSLVKEKLRGRASLCYAMKANPFLVKHMTSLVESFEVCSPGEYRICNRLSIPMERIVLSGVNKEEAEICRIVEEQQGLGTYTIESPEHLRILEKASGRVSRRIRVLLRLTSGNQFGMDEETIFSILKERTGCSGVDICGIQFYSGTQKKRLGIIQKELELLDQFYEKVEQELGYVMPELEYGPGFFVSYFQKEEPVNIPVVLEEFSLILQQMKFRGKITLEMGRFLSASCGYYFTEIVDTKCNYNQRYAIVDGGINHLNYYGQMMAMKHPYYQQLSFAAASGEEALWTICGSLCTVGDVLVKELPLRNAQIHDILVFENLGAYSVTEGIYLFLSRDLPAVYVYSRGTLSLIRDIQPTDTLNAAL